MYIKAIKMIPVRYVKQEKAKVRNWALESENKLKLSCSQTKASVFLACANAEINRVGGVFL